MIKTVPVKLLGSLQKVSPICEEESIPEGDDSAP